LRLVVCSSEDLLLLSNYSYTSQAVKQTRDKTGLSSGAMEEHLKEQVMKTGYPLEIQISDLLDGEWIVFNNDTYRDLEEQKSREIDIFAIHTSEPDQLIRQERSPLFVMTELIVECKKTDTHAWVFFTRPRQYSSVGDGQIIDSLKMRSEGKVEALNPYNLDLHYKAFDRIARTYSEVKLQGESSGKSEIFESSNQLTRCVRCYMDQQRELVLRDPSIHHVGIYFLAMALDGRLYEAVVNDGGVSLYPRDHILLAAQRHWVTGPQSYAIDVVTKQYFAQYLKVLDSDIETFRSCLASIEGRILSKIKIEK
jgi:hypothetical protein